MGREVSTIAARFAVSPPTAKVLEPVPLGLRSRVPVVTVLLRNWMDPGFPALRRIRRFGGLIAQTGS